MVLIPIAFTLIHLITLFLFSFHSESFILRNYGRKGFFLRLFVLLFLQLHFIASKRKLHFKRIQKYHPRTIHCHPFVDSISSHCHIQPTQNYLYAPTSVAVVKPVVSMYVCFVSRYVCLTPYANPSFF
ncbi:hypothetical protein BKA70DRAFT_752800 [Coprinopsis sp. MPI-PUGE-AT-0042]|nr:hypothetical protein BKA70DRAFT_752800 [Coprinopsis sp. MPI-PUGE-AT-0042]